MPIVAPDIARFAINGTLDGQDVINLVDLRITGSADRGPDLFIIAGDIIDAWVAEVLPALHTGYSFDSVSWVDLDSEGGLTGSRASTVTNTLPETGTNGGGILPSNAAVIVRKVLGGKTRQQRNGSMRISGIPEDFTLPGQGNFLTSDAVTGFNEALTAFQATLEGYTLATVEMVVVHTVEGAYSGFSTIQAMSTRSQIGTQRRRMPGYGD